MTSCPCIELRVIKLMEPVDGWVPRQELDRYALCFTQLRRDGGCKTSLMILFVPAFYRIKRQSSLSFCFGFILAITEQVTKKSGQGGKKPAGGRRMTYFNICYQKYSRKQSYLRAVSS